MPQYRIEISPNNRAGCKDAECKKRADKCTKGTIRFGTWVEIQEHGSWQWKHWGCVSGAQLVSLQDACDQGDGSYDFEAIDGYDELEDGDVKDKIERCVKQGHIDPEDFNGDPEKNKPGEKGIHLTAKQREKLDKEAQAKMASPDASDEGPPVKKSKKRGRKNEGEDDEPQPKKTKAAKRSKTVKDEDEEDDSQPKKTKKTKAATKPSKAVKDEDEEDAAPAKPARGRKAASKKVKEESEPEDEESDEPAPAPKKARKSAGGSAKVASAVPAKGAAKGKRSSMTKTAAPDAEPATAGRKSRSTRARKA